MCSKVSIYSVCFFCFPYQSRPKYHAQTTDGCPRIWNASWKRIHNIYIYIMSALAVTRVRLVRFSVYIIISPRSKRWFSHPSSDFSRAHTPGGLEPPQLSGHSPITRQTIRVSDLFPKFRPTILLLCVCCVGIYHSR